MLPKYLEALPLLRLMSGSDEQRDLEDGMLAAPHPMVEGLSDGDYYRGEVAGPTEAQIDWVRARRPDDPSLDTAKPVSAASEGAAS